MWRALENPNLGFMNVFSESIASFQRENPGSLPDLSHCRTVIAVSDYGGFHKTSQFESYSLLLACGESWPDWENARLRLRREFQIGKRRFAFSKMGDTRKRRALLPFLATAEVLHGLLVTVLVDKGIDSLFVTGVPLDPSAASHLSRGVGYTERTFERLLRAIHFVSFFVAGLSAPGQDLIWLTDEDEIAANPRGLTTLTSIFANVASHYLPHNLRHLRCGTTASDNGSLQIEDLAALPDLVAGALTELLTAYYREGSVPDGPLVAPPPRNLSGKTCEIVRWLSVESHRLKHLAYVIQGGLQVPAPILKRLQLHSETLAVA